ncbi:MAG: hypothetical protein HQK70_12100 [Desulfamplus sp.]|nr:hypothetical protein [Desulfamplus sp.]
MTGIQEILTIGFIIVCIFFIPRLFRDTQSNSHKNCHKKTTFDSKMSGKMRLGIVLSVMLPLFMLFILKPWEGNLIIFMCIGIVPVAVGWSAVWIRDGFRNRESSE